MNRYLNLSPTKSFIFHYILSFTFNGKDEDGYCFSSRETMAKALNISLSTLDANIKKLLKDKLICKTNYVSHNRVYPMYCINIDNVLKLILESKRMELDQCIEQVKLNSEIR